MDSCFNTGNYVPRNPSLAFLYLYLFLKVKYKIINNTTTYKCNILQNSLNNKVN